MDDEEVIVILSSPEPEQEIMQFRLNKGKGRATNQDRGVVCDEDAAPPTAALTNYLPPDTSAHSTGKSTRSGGSQPVASGSGAMEDVRVLDDPIQVTMIQVLDVIPNVEAEHLHSLIRAHQSQRHEDVSRLRWSDRGTHMVAYRLEQLLFHTCWKTQTILNRLGNARSRVMMLRVQVNEPK